MDDSNGTDAELIFPHRRNVKIRKLFGDTEHMEYSRRFRNKTTGSPALQPRDGKSYRAQNIAPHEIAGNATSERQSLVFATFALVKDSFSLGHVWLKVLTENLKKNFLVSFPGVQLHQRAGNGINVGAVDYDAWSYRFFHEHNHSHSSSMYKALYTKIIINKTNV